MNYESIPDPRIVYADIIDLPHHQSAKRKHMSLHDRAAQFAPFAALVGYDEMVDEEARLTDRQITPGESDLDRLDRIFRCLSAKITETSENRAGSCMASAAANAEARPRSVIANMEQPGLENACCSFVFS